jgi:CRISPR-associated protein Cas1
MIKRTLYFGNPVILNKWNDQLVVRYPEIEKQTEVIEETKKASKTTIPIEDIGIVILDDKQISITQGLIEGLIANNVAIISCDNTHHPAGLMMPLCCNTIQSERFRFQIDATEPLKKQLWQQTIKVKIKNQAFLLKEKEINIKNMLYWADEVKSGDADNHEARAAAYFWANIFPKELNFKREREGFPPNNLLNYGYAILRAITARSLVASGLLPTFGIHHHNRYNAYCLADDIMEPYRPFVDMIVIEILKSGQDYTELNKSIKQQILTLPTLDIIINEQRSPLMIGMLQTTASLAKCFEGEIRKITYPEMINKQ